jgi:hypothetical protein
MEFVCADLASTAVKRLPHIDMPSSVNTGKVKARGMCLHDIPPTLLSVKVVCSKNVAGRFDLKPTNSGLSLICLPWCHDPATPRAP